MFPLHYVADISKTECYSGFLNCQIDEIFKLKFFTAYLYTLGLVKTVLTCA